MLCCNLQLPCRLDISDEFKQVISTLRGHDDKVSRHVRRSQANLTATMLNCLQAPGVLPQCYLTTVLAAGLLPLRKLTQFWKSEL
jgi:hypothetical protein